MDSEGASREVAAGNAARTQTLGLAFGLFGALAFSAKAIIVKLAYRHGVDAVTLIMYRMLFALPLFLLMALWAGRAREALTGKDWAGVVGLGFTGYYLSSFLDFAGLQYVSASLERLILYTSPTLVLLLGFVIYRRPVKGRQALGMSISYAGIVLVLGHEGSLEGRNVALGATLIFLSALAYAIYLTYSGELVRRLGAMRLVGLASTVACLLCCLQFLMLRPLASAAVGSQVLWLSVVNATVCTALPVLLIMMAVERVGAAAASQVGMVGPLATILMGVWILDEPFTLWVAAGTALVVAGIFVFSRAAFDR